METHSGLASHHIEQAGGRANRESQGDGHLSPCFYRQAHPSVGQKNEAARTHLLEEAL